MDNQAVINEMIAKGRKALAELESYTQEQIDELCRVCCEAFREHAEELAAERMGLSPSVIRTLLVQGETLLTYEPLEEQKKTPSSSLLRCIRCHLSSYFF